MSRRNSLQLPLGIPDREDRMLAYYINLIKQQEEEDVKKRERSGSVSVDEDMVKEGRDSDRNSVASDDQPVKRPVGRPRKHPVEVVTKITPKKTTKQLELDEAERIIATILERRPGRAEFKVPVVVEKESVVEPPQEPEVTSFSPPKKSAKTLALEEAERIIATIERRPTVTSAKALDDTKLVSVQKQEEKKIVVVEEVVQKRGPGRPPKKIEPQILQPEVEDEKLTPIITPAVPEEVVKKRGPGRPPKNPAQPPVVVVSPAAESPKPKPAEPRTITPRKRPPSPAHEKPAKSQKQETVEPVVPLTTSSSALSFTFHHPIDRKPKWWRDPIGLKHFPIDDDLHAVVNQVVKRATETSEDVLKHARVASSEPFVARMVVHIE